MTQHVAGSRGEEKEATRPERMDESRVKEASCWEGQGEGEEDQPRREPKPCLKGALSMGYYLAEAKASQFGGETGLRVRQ